MITNTRIISLRRRRTANACLITLYDMINVNSNGGRYLERSHSVQRHLAPQIYSCEDIWREKLKAITTVSPALISFSFNPVMVMR